MTVFVLCWWWPRRGSDENSEKLHITIHKTKICDFNIYEKWYIMNNCFPPAFHNITDYVLLRFWISKEKIDLRNATNDISIEYKTVSQKISRFLMDHNNKMLSDSKYRKHQLDRVVSHPINSSSSSYSAYNLSTFTWNSSLDFCKSYNFPRLRPSCKEYEFMQ